MSALSTRVMLFVLSHAVAMLLGWHFGRQGLEVKQQKAEIAQERAQDKKRSTDRGTIAQEGKTYENAGLDPLPSPVVRLCYSPAAAPVPGSRAPGLAPHAAASSRSADPVPDTPGPNIGPTLVRTGHVADAQVIGLQDYITRVCLAGQ